METTGDPVDNKKKKAGWKDRRIGENLRRMRLVAGLAQEEVAARLGITYQQVQKYERGESRLSASRMYDLAAYFHVPYASFFEGLGGGDTAASPMIRGHDQETLKILALLSGIEDAALKRKIGQVVEVLAR